MCTARVKLLRESSSSLKMIRKPVNRNKQPAVHYVVALLLLMWITVAGCAPLSTVQEPASTGDASMNHSFVPWLQSRANADEAGGQVERVLLAAFPPFLRSSLLCAHTAVCWADGEFESGHATPHAPRHTRTLCDLLAFSYPLIFLSPLACPTLLQAFAFLFLLSRTVSSLLFRSF